VIRFRGFPISPEEATELATRLREQGDRHGLRVAERLERGVLMGTALVGTDRFEARATLEAIEAWAPEHLRAIAGDLRDYLGPGIDTSQPAA
jgi:hypothetical protein